MTIEEVRRQHQAQPFNPFRINMADGRSVDVDHPEFLAFSRNGRVVYVTTPGHGLESIDLLLVSSLTAIRKQEKRSGNGRKKHE